MDNLKAFNLTELGDVVNVLAITNPTHGSNHIRNKILSLAQQEIPPGHASYVSTMGFCISGYWYCGDITDWRYKVTLCSWGVEKYLKDQAKENTIIA